MKVTIYELLGLVKDGKAPKKIKYHNEILHFDDETKNYYNDEDMHSLFSGVSYKLNDEVEILEEGKKIPEKLNGISNFGDLAIHYPDNKQLMDKINEIINYLNYLKSKGDE